MRAVPSFGPIISRWPENGAEARARPRILVVGDSFTAGRGVGLDQVYPARLAAELERLGHPTEVVSFSFPGWNTRTEAAALKQRIEGLDPDLLLVGYCLNDAEKRPTGEATSDRPDLRPWSPTGPAGRFLDAHSRLFSRTRRALDTLRLRPILRRYYAQLYEDEEGLRLWRGALGSLERMAADRSIPAVLVIFPIFDSDPDSDYPYRKLHDLVDKTGAELGYRVLDLFNLYEGREGRDLALVPFTDPHPSALAHDLAGQGIARYLLDADLVP
jgi:lysophospholipase L1-like esterase